MKDSKNKKYAFVEISENNEIVLESYLKIKKIGGKTKEEIIASINDIIKNEKMALNIFEILHKI